MSGAPAGHTASLEALGERWLESWPRALALWSRFVKLGEPRFCLSAADEQREGLSGSFAMIRLDGHVVVISLKQVAEQGLEAFPLEIMAHEIGHHVLAPADLTDQARLIARIRRGLPTKEGRAGFVANLYTDLLINDRLQRQAGLKMADVYRKLGAGGASDRCWTFYMRIYEVLWSLERGTLAAGPIDRVLDVEAGLGARVVRAYAKDWLKGAGRFAALIFAYLEENDGQELEKRLRGILDSLHDTTGEIPDGLSEIEADEEDGAIHPALDGALTGIEEDGDRKPRAGGAAEKGDSQPRKRYRGPAEYADILKSIGVELPPHELVARYYRERAIPHLIPFPVKIIPQSSDPLPEGLEGWEAGDALERLDVVESLTRHSRIIPGLTTVQRTWGTASGSSPEREPLDLYIGVDCSGSMSNPAFQMSFPVLAGVIMAVSALRARARVMVALSGEPGQWAATEGFVRDERAILTTLTSYLGTGYSFGIHRLADTFAERKPGDRPVHVLIVTDHDMFAMLDEKRHGKDGWEVAAASLAAARGGGTYVLHMQAAWGEDKVKRMRADGWDVVFVSEWEDVVKFAEEFSRRKFHEGAS